MKTIILIAHDVRSTHNVGSLLRTADGMGIDKVYLTGYTPYPLKEGDSRLPHLSLKQHNAIHKTALGAEETMVWERIEKVFTVISRLKQAGYTICALEQAKHAIKLAEYNSPEKIALLLGTEVTGLPQDILKLCDQVLEIPMSGKKESLNVVQAAAMAMFQLRFH